MTWNSVSGASRYELQRKKSTSTTWTEIHDGSATSKYITDPTQGLFYHRVCACKVFACSGWSSAASTQVSTGEDCDDDGPLLTPGMTTEDEATSNGDVVIMGPPCPIEP